MSISRHSGWRGAFPGCDRGDGRVGFGWKGGGGDDGAEALGKSALTMSSEKEASMQGEIDNAAGMIWRHLRERAW